MCLLTRRLAERLMLHSSLRGHRDQITAIRFISTSEDLPSTSTASPSGLLLTSSKDTFMKLWDLSTQHCVQTIVAHRSEIWTMDIDREQNLVFTGSSEGELKAWRIDQEALAEGLKETESGEVDIRDCISYCPNSPSFLGCENDTPHSKPSSVISSQGLANNIPPYPAVPCSAISRSVR